MTQGTQEERWSEIYDFPGYSISDWGRVMNDDTKFFIRITKNSHGSSMVGLMKSGRQHKRSLPLLVARAFLSRPVNDTFDTPIHLDGDRANNHYTNLMWRPLWFSRKYMRQFTDNHTTCNIAIEDVETGEQYESSMHAATTLGLLDSELCLSMHNNGYVWPTGQVFRKVVVH